MATIYSVLNLAAAPLKLHRRLAGSILALKRSIDKTIIRERTDLMLRTLDKRVRIEAGVEIQNEKEARVEDRNDDPAGIRLAFSWTRFAK